MVIMLFSTCLPNDIMHTSVAMREAWQVLFVMLSAWLSIQFANIKDIRFLIVLFVSLTCLGSLHPGLYYLAILWPFIFWGTLKILKIYDRVDILLKIILTGLLFLILALFLVYLVNSHANLLYKIFAYNTHMHLGGSTYPTFLGPKNSAMVNLSHIPLSVLYYWFYPFPWEIHRIKDIYGCFLGIMRLFFILYSFYFIFKAPESRQRHLGWALLMILLIISVFFAIGTANYGTSMRHNILTFWGFVMLGTAGFYLHLQQFYKKRANRQ